MADKVPWDDQTNQFILQLDKSVLEAKYKMKLYDVLMKPEQYIGRQDAVANITKMRADVDTFFKNAISNLGDEQKRFEGELQKADGIYKTIGDAVKDASTKAKLPFIKPMFITRDTKAEEVIIIEEFADPIEDLVLKLAKSANFVADFSIKYKKYNIGSWFFSGHKNYLLTVNAPTSIILTLERSSGEILSRLDTLIKA